VGVVVCASSIGGYHIHVDAIDKVCLWQSLRSQHTERIHSSKPSPYLEGRRGMGMDDTEILSSGEIMSRGGSSPPALYNITEEENIVLDMGARFEWCVSAAIVGDAEAVLVCLSSQRVFDISNLRQFCPHCDLRYLAYRDLRDSRSMNS